MIFASPAFFGAASPPSPVAASLPSIASPYMGVDADASNTLWSNTAGTTPAVPGGGVAKIGDAFGGTGAFVQATTSAQAEMAGAAVNGRRALRFSTGGTRYYSQTGLVGNTIRDASWTVLCAYVPRSAGGIAPQYIFRVGHVSPADARRHMGLLFQPRVAAVRHTDIEFVTATDASYTYRDNEVVLVCARWSRAGGLRMRAIASGGTREVMVPAGSDDVDGVNWNLVLLGANVDAAGAFINFFSGDICELRVWTSLASDAEVLQGLEYLSAKWAGTITGPQPPTTPQESAPVPSGWVLAFEDEFTGSALDTAKWKITYDAGQSPNNDARWDARGRVVSGGTLNLRLFTESGVWRGGGIQQGNSAVGFNGYLDFQVEVEAEIPEGQGVGVYAVMWPVSDQWPPEFDLFETPGKLKETVLTNWHWPGTGGAHMQAPATFSVNVKRRIRYIARRTSGAWRYWTYDIVASTLTEHPVPPQWAANPRPERLALGIAMFVAQPGATWYGGAPDGTTPDPYEVKIHSARVYAPNESSPPVGTRSISTTPAGPGSLTETTLGAGQDWVFTANSTGLSQLTWVVVQSGTWTWRGSPVTVSTSGSVQITARMLASGDFVKILDPNDYAFYHDTGTATILAPGGGGTPPPVTGGLAQAQAFTADLTLGLNVERFNSYGWAGLQTTTTYWGYLKARGFTHVRLFYPYRTRADWAAPPTAEGFNQILNSTAMAISAGLKVFLDFTDVLEDWDLDDFRLDQINAFIAMAATETAKRNFDPNKICVGPVNEYADSDRAGAGKTNLFWQPHRHRWMGVLRAALPNLTLCEGPGYWKDLRYLYGGAGTHAYVPWPGDLNVVQDVHHYSDWDFNGLISMAQSCLNWSAANQNRPVYSGEWGTGGAFEMVGSTPLPYADWDWIRRWDAVLPAPAVANLAPTLWCVTGGAAWTMNLPGGGYLKDGSNSTVDLQSACTRLAGEIAAARALGEDPPPEEEPPPSDPASVTVDGEYPVFSGTASPLTKAALLARGQSNAGFYGSEAIWHTNGGMAAMLGGTHGRYYATGGLEDIDAWLLPQGVLTSPERFTTVGGMPLWKTGDNGCFLDCTGGGAASTWPRGWAGNALTAFITSTMSSGDRAACPGVFFFHTEDDSKFHNYADLATHIAALRRTMEFTRTDMGKTAAQLPFFASHPIPYDSNMGGHRMIREAYATLAADATANFHVALPQTADSYGGLRYGATERDYSHRDTTDLVLFARRLAFGVGRVLNSQRGIGSTAFPGLGPKVIHAQAESSTSTLLTIAHDKGNALSLGSGAGDGRGWVMHDNTTDRAVTAAAIVGNNQVRLTHVACTGAVGDRKVSYCLYGQEIGRGSAIYDNFAARPDPVGWPAGLDGAWKFNFPVRGTLVPLQVSSSAFVP